MLAGSEFCICLRVEDGVRRSHRMREEIAQAREDMKRRWGSECGMQNGGRGHWSQWARMTEGSLSPDPEVPPPLSSDLRAIVVKRTPPVESRQQMLSKEQKGSILTLTVSYVA